VVNGDLWGKMCVFSGPGTVLPVGTENRLHEFIELVATAISNYEARADLAASESRALELANEQAALRRIATLVAEGAAPQDVFDAVRREVAEVFDVPFTVLWRFDPDGMATVLSVDRGYLGPAGTRWPIEGDTNIAARVRRTGRAARVDFPAPGHSPGSITDAARRAGIRSGVGVPIVVEGELWGSMTVGSEKVERLPAELERRLERFTELLATAIANAKSRVEVTQLAAEQAALRRVATLVAQGAEPRHVFAAVAEEVAGIIDIPVVGVYRYEADGTFTMLGIAGDTDFTVGSRWPVEEEGIAGMILATGRPARRDEDSTMPGRLSQAARGDLMIATVGIPIVVEGSIWGFMVAVARPGRPIPTDTEERLARFTELAATAVSNANTRTELLASRARVVSAADETRRRVERDLHDGIQQWLVALALRARKAALSEAGDSAMQELSGLAEDLVAVTDELREISRGIHPAILSDAGLDAALKTLARRSVIRVDLDVDFQGRYDPTLEATVYYVVAESITNAVKHAQASIVEVRGGLRDGAIEFEIKDDGVGGADPRRGTGMIGLKDRVETLGGTISFASSAGAGTTIHVSLPASPGDEEDLLLRGSDEDASAPA
jgi:signal transduction histidine kinase